MLKYKDKSKESNSPDPFLMGEIAVAPASMFISAFQNFIFISKDYLHQYLTDIGKQFGFESGALFRPVNLLERLQAIGWSQRVEDEDFDQFQLHPLLSFKMKKQLNISKTSTELIQLLQIQFNYYERYGAMLDKAFFQERQVEKELLGFKLLELELDNLLSFLSNSLSAELYSQQIPGLLFNFFIKKRATETLHDVTRSLIYPSYLSGKAKHNIDQQRKIWLSKMTYLLAKHLEIDGDLVKAEHFFQEFMKNNKISDTPHKKAITGLLYAKLGNIKLKMGKLEDSINYFNRSLSIYDKSLKLEFPKVEVFDGLAQVYYRLKNWNKSLVYKEQSLNLYRQFNDKRGIASSLQHFGIVLQAKKEYSKSMTFYTEALITFTHIGDRISEAAVLTNIGLLYKDIEQFSESTSHIKRALNIYIEECSIEGQAISFFTLAGNLFFEKKEEECKDYILKALQLNIILKELDTVNQLLELAQNIALLTQDMNFVEKALYLLPPDVP